MLNSEILYHLCSGERGTFPGFFSILVKLSSPSPLVTAICITGLIFSSTEQLISVPVGLCILYSVYNSIQQSLVTIVCNCNILRFPKLAQKATMARNDVKLWMKI